MVRKISLVCIAVVAVFAFTAASVFAASSDSLAIKVTVNSTLGVDITEPTVDFGSVGVGTTSLSTAGVSVTNTGSGIAETYQLNIANPSGWTASQSAVGNNVYVLNAAFDNDGTGITWSAANDALSATPVSCSATKFAGDQTGLSVPSSAVRKLWFQFLAPTQSSVSTQQTITLTITAVAS